jgi:hypothetical protein
MGFGQVPNPQITPLRWEDHEPPKGAIGLEFLLLLGQVPALFLGKLIESVQSRLSKKISWISSHLIMGFSYIRKIALQQTLDLLRIR